MALADTQVRRGDRGRGRFGPARRAGTRHRGPQGRRPLQGLPDPLAHRRRAGRGGGVAGQHGRGQLALAHVRHHQGVGLAGRPGCDRVHVPHGARGRDRARALRHALRPQRERHHLPAPLRRAHAELRRAPGAALVLRRRPHRARDAAHALPAERPREDAVLRRVDGPGPGARCRRRRAGRERARDGDGRHRPLPGQGDAASPRAGRGASSPPPPTPTSTRATGWAWRRAPASRSRTWSSGSSTPPGWRARAS